MASKARVMVVEDELVAASSLAYRLAKLGYEITAMPVSGEEAVQQALQSPPDLVLMDIRLRGEMDGITAAQMIGEQLDVPVIYLSALTEEETIQRASLTEPYGYLLKPFDTHELAITMDMALYKHSMEKKLKQSEERYRKLFNEMLDGFGLSEIVLDEQGKAVDFRLLEVNPAFERLTGISREQLLGKLACSEVLPDMDPEWIDFFGKVALSGEPAYIEKYSKVFQKYLKVVAYCSEPGKFAVLFTDITERKTAEEALRIFTEDLETRVKELNLLYTCSKILANREGSSLQEKLALIVRLIPAAFRNPGKISARLTMQGASYLTESFKESTCRLVTEIVANHQTLGRLEVFHNDESTPECQNVFSNEDYDLATELANRLAAAFEQQQAEEALRESEQRFSSVVKSATDAIVLLDDKGKILSWNHAAETTFGYREVEALGMHMENILPQRYRQQQLRGFRKLKNARDEFGELIIGRLVEMHALHKDGNEIPVELSLSHWQAAGRDFYSGILRDITWRKQASRQQDAIIAVSTALRQTTTQHEMLPVILQIVQELLATDYSLLGLFTPSRNQFILQEVAGSAGRKEGLEVATKNGLLVELEKSGEARFLQRVQPDERTQPFVPLAGVGALAAIPLNVKDEMIGVLFAGREQPFSDGDSLVLHSIGEIAANAIQRASLHERTQRSLRRLEALHKIDQAISSVMDLDITLGVLLDQVMTHLEVDVVNMLLYRQTSRTLEQVAGRGFYQPAPRRPSQFLNQGPAGQAVISRKILHIPEIAQSEEYSSLFGKQGEGFVGYFAAPLIAKGIVKGVLELYLKRAFTPDAEWLNFLELLAGQAAIAIDSATLFDDLQRSNLELALAYDTTLEGWVKTLEMRSHETMDHSWRVTEMTLQLAQGFGMRDESLAHLRRGALLHDIGKMAVPDAILNKPGALTEEEWEIMRRHPTFAYEMLTPIAYLRPALEIPYCHHEKWDGSGYPRRLAGEQIPLAARIFAVIDVWDALRSDRPYRKAWSDSDALAHIRQQAGVHFDPQVVEAFLKLV